MTLPYESVIPFLDIYLTHTNVKKCTHTYGHCSTIYNNPDLKTAEVPSIRSEQYTVDKTLALHTASLGSSPLHTYDFPSPLEYDPWAGLEWALSTAEYGSKNNKTRCYSALIWNLVFCCTMARTGICHVK